MLLWSLEVLAAYGCNPLVVVVPEEHVAAGRALADPVGAVVTRGGDTRQESVARGLAFVDAPVVVVHDAARPFVTHALLDDVTHALDGFDAAILATPVEETVKLAAGGRVVETIDRSSLWRVQTPQAFRTQALSGAHARAAADGFVGTDDAQLVERAGGSVAIARGDRHNLKVTYDSDFAVAEAIARAR